MRCKQTRRLWLVNGIATRIPISAIEDVAKDPRVRRITHDRSVHALLDVAAPTAGAPSLWQNNFTGKGVTVAVVDTGIYPHTDFQTPNNRIVSFKDFVGNGESPYDDNGHGTHVAGIIGGSGSLSHGAYRGIAPEANLIGVKVLDRVGNGTLSTVIEGIQWCVDHKEDLGIRVINLSIGAPAEGTYRDDPVAHAVGAAWDQGIVVCAAAGNDGPASQSIATPGIHPRIITVGASDDYGTKGRKDDTIAAFSSRGPTSDGTVKPDVVAPGVDITSANSPKSTLAAQQGTKHADYVTLSGTSMSTPVCSGIVALMLQADPTLGPDRVKERLVGSAESMGVDANTQGSGLVYAPAAVEIH